MVSSYFLQVECGAAINIENVYNLTPLTLVGNIDFTGLRMIENGLKGKLDPVGSTVRYKMMKLCTGPV